MCLSAKPTSRIFVLKLESILQLRKDTLSSEIMYGLRSEELFLKNTSLDLERLNK